MIRSYNKYNKHETTLFLTLAIHSILVGPSISLEFDTVYMYVLTFKLTIAMKPFWAFSSSSLLHNLATKQNLKSENFVKIFLHSLKLFNETHIVLLPNVKNPTKIYQYRSISLNNVVSWLASKVLANRLKCLFPQIISENQSPFMSNWLITGNVLVAFETVHHISQKKSGKVGEMALKLDMSKAYDGMEWGCLKKIMQKMGFNAKWVNIMMRCVQTVSYSVLINGKPCGNITLSRGLRQGDPLSPYLFLLFVEGLSTLLQTSVHQGLLRGVAAFQGAPMISHLFFVDDSLIFCKATREDCSNLEMILETYEQASGQQLNKYKTSLFFSRNTPLNIQDEINTQFGAKVIQQHEKYLGLPSLVGKNKCNTFRQLIERLDDKFSGWKEKLLSHVGKEILIKIVAQVVPTCTMTVFKLSNALCDEMTSMVRNFWWGQTHERTKMAWLSWDKICLLKEEGGLGFQDLKAFNLTSLAKQGWRLQNCTNTLVHKVFKAWYFPNGDFLSTEASNGQNYKKFWKLLWDFNVPNKIKNFAWWASRNILPTKTNLYHQKIIADLTCEACGLGAERSGHLLWSYPKA